MKIAFVTAYDAMDIHYWSGTSYSMAKMLENQGADVQYIGNLRTHSGLYQKMKRKFYQRFFKKDFDIGFQPAVAKAYAKQIQKCLRPNTDIVFSPGSLTTAYLETSIPKVFYSDATFAGLLGFYENYSNLCTESVRNGNAIEQKALESAALAIYSSDWAAQSAIHHYQVDPDKVKVVPFGANLSTTRDLEEVKKIVYARPEDSLDLLFLAVEWDRKGGELAVQVAEQLNKQGIKTTLHIVGIREFPLQPIPDFVVNYGFISKRTTEGVKRIENLLQNSHFLILPSKADCTPIVYSESNSFGLPCLTTKVGGIPTIIKDEKNGCLFSLNDPASEWCDRIVKYHSDRTRYEELCLSSFKEYKNRLNWDAAGQSVMQLLKNLV